MIDSKVTLHDIFYDISMNFLCSYPLLFTAGMCDVTYIRVYNTYLHGKCFLSTLYTDIICLMSTQSTLLFVSSDSSSHAYATSRSSSLCTDQCHTPCRNTACSVSACAANTRDTAVGLGLPLEMPIAVKFSCCEWIINSQTRISQKFLHVILPPRDLCIRNAFRMVMSVR